MIRIMIMIHILNICVPAVVSRFLASAGGGIDGVEAVVALASLVLEAAVGPAAEAEAEADEAEATAEEEEAAATAERGAVLGAVLAERRVSTGDNVEY